MPLYTVTDHDEMMLLVRARDAEHAIGLAALEWLLLRIDAPELDAISPEWEYPGFPPEPDVGAIHHGVWQAPPSVYAGYGGCPEGYDVCQSCVLAVPEEDIGEDEECPYCREVAR